MLLIIYRQEFDRDLMLKLLDVADWDEIHVVDFRSALAQFNLIFSLLWRIRNIGYCFLGDYTSSINILLNCRKPGQIIWVDDGVATLQCAHLIASGEFFRLTKQYRRKSLVSSLIEKLTKSHNEYLRKVEFFTIYDHIRSYSKSLRVRDNDYRYFREKISSLPSRDTIFFIGNDLRRFVLNDPERFEAYIAYVSRHYAGREWRYILHRKEDVLYMQKIADKYGFVMEKFDRILEQQFLWQGWYPSEIATICSSALDTLNILYNPKLVAFRLQPEDICAERTIVIQELYKHYEKMNVTILDID